MISLEEIICLNDKLQPVRIYNQILCFFQKTKIIFSLLEIL